MLLNWFKSFICGPDNKLWFALPVPKPEWQRTKVEEPVVREREEHPVTPHDIFAKDDAQIPAKVKGAIAMLNSNLRNRHFSLSPQSVGDCLEVQEIVVQEFRKAGWIINEDKLNGVVVKYHFSR